METRKIWAVVMPDNRLLTFGYTEEQAWEQAEKDLPLGQDRKMLEKLGAEAVKVTVSEGWGE